VGKELGTQEELCPSLRCMFLGFVMWLVEGFFDGKSVSCDLMGGVSACWSGAGLVRRAIKPFADSLIQSLKRAGTKILLWITELKMEFEKLFCRVGYVVLFSEHFVSFEVIRFEFSRKKMHQGERSSGWGVSDYSWS
jgi:hypothetical protein